MSSKEGDIQRGPEPFEALWRKGFSPTQLAEKEGVSVDVIYRRLKAMQKQLVNKGAEKHETKTHI
jgi:transposase